MNEENKEKEVDVMTTMKPIQATPELCGKDAEKLLKQVNIAPTQKALRKNKMLHSVLTNIRKA